MPTEAFDIHPVSGNAYSMTFTDVDPEAKALQFFSENSATVVRVVDLQGYLIAGEKEEI